MLVITRGYILNFPHPRRFPHRKHRIPMDGEKRSTCRFPRREVRYTLKIKKVQDDLVVTGDKETCGSMGYPLVI